MHGNRQYGPAPVARLAASHVYHTLLPSATGGKLPLSQALKVSADILDGLEELHSHGVVVLDLKPDSVLMTESGHAVLSDFGISRIVKQPSVVVRGQTNCGCVAYLRLSSAYPCSLLLHRCQRALTTLGHHIMHPTIPITALFFRWPHICRAMLRAPSTTWLQSSLRKMSG